MFLTVLLLAIRNVGCLLRIAAARPHDRADESLATCQAE
jgi:hypothetical protein